MNFAIIGVVIVIVSALVGIFLTRRHKEEQQTPVKMIIFGLYFWGLVFLQLLIAAFFYVLSKHGF